MAIEEGDKILTEDGFHLVLEDGSGDLLLEVQVIIPEGGGSGRKGKGVYSARAGSGSFSARKGMGSYTARKGRGFF